jgi:hypothetical protein
MNAENGVQGGLRHFLDCLPRDNMLCDVSLILFETKLAKYRLAKNGVKISLEIASMLQSKPLQRPDKLADFFTNIIIAISTVLNFFNPIRETRYVRHSVTTYALGRVQNVGQGCLAGICGFIIETFRGLFQVYSKSDTFARSHGAFGCLFGLLVSPIFLVMIVLHGIIVLFDRILVGFFNAGAKDDKLFIIDPSVRAQVYQTTTQVDDLLRHEKPGEARQLNLRKALRIAGNAKQLFNDCKPEFPEGHWHWKEVKVDKLKEKVIQNGQSRLSLKDHEHKTLLELLNACGLDCISFSRLCLFLGEALKIRFMEPPPRLSLKHAQSLVVQRPSYSALYGPPEDVGTVDPDDALLQKPSSFVSLRGLKPVSLGLPPRARSYSGE